MELGEHSRLSIIRVNQLVAINITLFFYHHQKHSISIKTERVFNKVFNRPKKSQVNIDMLCLDFILPLFSFILLVLLLPK